MTTDPRLNARQRGAFAPPVVSLFAGWLVIGIALTTFAIWATDMPDAAALVPGLNRMNPMTAASLVLAGSALLLPRVGRSRAVGAPVAGPARLILGSAVAAIGAAKIAHLLALVAIAVDLLLFPEQVIAMKRSFMAPNTAAALVLIGAAIALTAFRSRWTAVAAQLCAAAVLIVATITLIAYAYGAAHLYEFPNSSVMALQTAVCLAAAAIGVLWTRPTLGLTGIVTDRSMGGVTARWMLPTAILLTAFVGAARMAMMDSGLVNEASGIALHVAAMQIALAAVILVLANGLRRRDRRLAAKARALAQVASELVAARDAASEAAALKADFMANLSHEIRTPLTAIVGYASLLSGRHDLSPGAARHIARIDAAAQALAAIVNEVLDFSKVEAGRVDIVLQPVDPRGLVEGAVQLFENAAATKGLDLGIEFDPALPPCIRIDPGRTRQVLLNLIGNAIKFTDSGSVRVVASYDERAHRLEVRVVDTGRGLSEAQQLGLFKRFAQVDGGSQLSAGTGLGLAISKGLVEAMGGRIEVDSRPGGGSTFQFWLPAPLAEPPAAAAGATATRLDGLRVLLVDDDDANREIVVGILSPLGVQLTEAADGARGVAAAGVAPFDAVLMDIRMPGLDGLAAARLIREAAGPSARAPILAFTADIQVPESEQGRATFSGVVRKPVAPRDLIEALSRVTRPRAA